jgi:hypothetical protein
MERRLVWLALAAVFAVLGWLALPLARGEVLLDTDLGRFYLPFRHFYEGALHTGDRFTWFPYQYTGFHLHGEGQLALFHPLNLLLYRLFPLAPAFHLEFLRSYVFLLVGTYLFMRRWTLPRSAALFSALSFSFCGFNLLHFMHLNIVAAAAHLPWLLLAGDVALRSPRPGYRNAGALAFGLLTTSQLLIGHPQAVWMSLVVEGAYALLLLRGRTGPAARLAGAALLGIAGAALQLLPVWESLGRSFRADPFAGYVSNYAVAPVGLVQLVAPYLFETRVAGKYTAELSIYVGAVELALLVWLVLRATRLGAARPLAIGALGLALLALGLCLGDAGLLYRLQTALPVVGLFRAPARYAFVFQFASAVAAGIAFADLAATARSGPRPAWRSLWPLALVPAASVAAALASDGLSELAAAHSQRPLAAAGPALVWVGPLLAVAAAGLTLAAARGRASALAGLVLLAAADHAAYGLSFIDRSERSTLEAILERPVRQVPAEGYRRYSGSLLLTMRGIRLVTGYAAMVPDRVLKEPARFKNDRHWDRLIQMLRVSSASSVYGSPVPDPMPRARLVTRAFVSRLPNIELMRIDLESTALVDRPLRLAGGPRGAAEIALDRPGEIHVATRSKSRQLLVVSESYHPGWSARIGDRECEVLPVYSDFMGCAVPAGEHLVRFAFDPQSLRAGARISAAALGLLLLGYGAPALRSLRRDARSARGAD